MSPKDLQTLLDRAELGDLMLAFGAALDSKDWSAYADTFVDQGRFTIMGQTRVGREKIAAGPARDLERFDRLQHFLTNPRIELDGDRAACSQYLLGVHVGDAADPTLHADIGGRYECRCVRTEDGWRFEEVTLEVIWAAGASFAVESSGSG